MVKLCHRHERSPDMFGDDDCEDCELENIEHLGFIIRNEPDVQV